MRPPGSPPPAALFRALYRIRRAEEEIVRLYPTDKIKSPVHLSIGQEAVSVGVCETLGSGDKVFGTYRNHALYLAKGGNLNRFMAELYGKSTGCAKGKGGSMHLVDMAVGVMGGSAVVGTTIPQAVGYAFGLKLQHQSPIVCSFFGDGAVEAGVFHESLNFAALKKLPIIFICENNGYAIHAPLPARQASQDICQMARAHGMPAERIEDNDVLAIHERVGAQVRQLKSGEPGPFFFECITYRWKEHVGPGEDYAGGYRTYDEAWPWISGDQVERMGRLLDASQRLQIEQEVAAEIAAAIEFAEASPFPDDAELFTDVFA